MRILGDMKTLSTPLLPLRAAARRIGVKPESLRQAAERGELPSLRVGEDLLFDVPTVERVLRERLKRKAVGHAH
jgi:hypothetical protein